MTGKSVNEVNIIPAGGKVSGSICSPDLQLARKVAIQHYLLEQDKGSTYVNLPFFFFSLVNLWHCSSLTTNPFTLRTVIDLCTHHHWSPKETLCHLELNWTICHSLLSSHSWWPSYYFYLEEIVYSRSLTQDRWCNIYPSVCD